MCSISQSIIEDSNDNGRQVIEAGAAVERRTTRTSIGTRNDEPPTPSCVYACTANREGRVSSTSIATTGTKRATSNMSINVPVPVSPCRYRYHDDENTEVTDGTTTDGRWTTTTTHAAAHDSQHAKRICFGKKKVVVPLFPHKDVQISHIVFWVCAESLTQFEWDRTLYIFFFECETARTQYFCFFSSM